MSAERTEATEDAIGDECVCGPYATTHCPLCLELHRLRAIEKRAKQVVDSLHGWSAEEAAAYIVTGVVQ